MEKKTQTKLMDITELAERLQVSEQTARRLIASGKIAYIRFGKLLKISEAQLAEFLEANTQR